MNGLEALDLSVLAPLLFVSGGALLVILGEVLMSHRATFLGKATSSVWVGTVLAFVSILFLALAFFSATFPFAEGSSKVFHALSPMLTLDPLANFTIALLALAAIFVCLMSVTYLAEMDIHHGEYYGLLLLATAGMIVLVAATDLMTLFLGIELMSIPIYVMAGFDRKKLRSNESALKYLIAGGFASAILLYGMALLYGATGHTDFAGIRSVLAAGNPPFPASTALALFGFALIVVGLAFKVSTVPFHQWTPDVYEGAPAPVTAYMSVCVKAAAFVALLRFLGVTLESFADRLHSLFWILALLTMTVGNVTALVQENVKRMLAYSSIAHAGYLLIALVVGTPEAYAALLLYLVVYLFMNLGAFGVMAALAHRGEEFDTLDQFSGLAKTRPGLALLMTLFMFALAGIPGTGGFIAKFTLFASAVHADQVWLVIFAVLNSLVSVFYYLRLPVAMYMKTSARTPARLDLGSGEVLVLTACAAAVLFLGFFPGGLDVLFLKSADVLSWTKLAITALVPGAAQG